MDGALRPNERYSYALSIKLLKKQWRDTNFWISARPPRSQQCAPTVLVTDRFWGYFYVCVCSWVVKMENQTVSYVHTHRIANGLRWMTQPDGRTDGGIWWCKSTSRHDSSQSKKWWTHEQAETGIELYIAAECCGWIWAKEWVVIYFLLTYSTVPLRPMRLCPSSL